MQNLREYNREQMSEMREERRSQIQDKYRELSKDITTEIKTEQQIIKYAEMLSQKNLVTTDVLVKIKNGLLYDEKIISAFMSNQAALVALTRLFSGNHINARHQLLAAHCLCNIAMGEDVHCYRLAKIAGSFLVLRMSGMNELLTEASAWAVGNLSRHSKVVELLRRQGAYTQATKLLSANNVEVKRAAVYCITHAFISSFAMFNDEEYLSVATAAVEGVSETSDLYLLYLTSHNRAAASFLMGRGVHIQTLARLKEVILQTEQSETSSLLLTLVRLVANLSAEASGQVAADLMKSEGLIYVLRNLTSMPALVEEATWFLANLMKHPALDCNSCFLEEFLSQVSH